MAFPARAQTGLPFEFPGLLSDRFFKEFEELEKRFFGGNGDFFKNLERHFNFPGGGLSQSEWREDNGHKILVIKGVPPEGQKLKVSVQGRQVTVEGTLEVRREGRQKNGQEEGQIARGFFQQRQIYRFSQQFQAPEGTDPSQVRVQNRDGEVHLLFPKVGTGKKAAPSARPIPAPPAPAPVRPPARRHAPPGTRPLEHRPGGVSI